MLKKPFCVLLISQDDSSRVNSIILATNVEKDLFLIYSPWRNNCSRNPVGNCSCLFQANSFQSSVCDLKSANFVMDSGLSAGHAFCPTKTIELRYVMSSL